MWYKASGENITKIIQEKPADVMEKLLDHIWLAMGDRYDSLGPL